MKETFSPALRLEPFRFILSTAVLKKFNIHLDVQTAFLNGDLADEIYMEIPDGFKLPTVNRNNQVFKPNKAIYGLKQSPRDGMKNFPQLLSQWVSNSEALCAFVVWY